MLEGQVKESKTMVVFGYSLRTTGNTKSNQAKLPIKTHCTDLCFMSSKLTLHQAARVKIRRLLLTKQLRKVHRR